MSLRKHRSSTCLVYFAALLAGACGDDDGGGGPSMVTATLPWDPAAGALFAFPDDAFTSDDASSRTGLRPELTPERVPMLADVPVQFQQMFADLGRLDGFGLEAGLYLQFDAHLDPATVTAETVVLAVETSSGVERWPYEHTLVDEATNRPDQTVILEPMRPLPPGAHAFVAVTSGLKAADGGEVGASPAMAGALAGAPSDPVSARVAPRMQADAEALVDGGVVASTDEVVAVVVFTTQTVWEEAAAIADDIRGRDIQPSEAPVCTTEAAWIRCEGHFTALDYRGTDEVIPETIAAAPASYEVPFTAWLPLTRPGPYGGAAFPIAIFGHGLGGERQQAERLALEAAPRGIATIAIDALAHGEHPTATETETLLTVLDFFAVSIDDATFDPLSMRDHFRQSTYDKLQLVRMISLGLDLDGDATVDLDPARLMYLGVSLGGIMGPELLQLAPEIGAGVLVVPGGRVSSIVKDGSMFGILVQALRPAGTTDGELARFWPVLQTLLDRGDAASWGAHLLDGAATRPAELPAAEPDLLVAMVIDDDTVPNVSTRALARAMDIPVVPPVLQEIGLVSTTPDPPISGNGEGGRTVGLLEFDRIQDEAGMLEPATHSNIGDSAVGMEAWNAFMDAWLTTGTAVIIDPYAALGF